MDERGPTNETKRGRGPHEVRRHQRITLARFDHHDVVAKIREAKRVLRNSPRRATLGIDTGKGSGDEDPHARHVSRKDPSNASLSKNSSATLRAASAWAA